MTGLGTRQLGSTVACSLVVDAEAGTRAQNDLCTVSSAQLVSSSCPGPPVAMQICMPTAHTRYVVPCCAVLC